MALESFLESNSLFMSPLVMPSNGAGGILEARSSSNSLQKEEHLGPILRMDQLNSKLTSDIVNATTLGKFSTFGSTVGHNAAVAIDNLTLRNYAYLGSNGSTNMEPYISLPSSPMPISSDNLIKDSFAAATFSHLCHGGQQMRKRQRMEKATGSNDLSKSKSQTCQDSLPIRIKEPDTPPLLKKTRLDANQENILRQQQQQFQGLLLKESLDCSPQLTAMFNQHRQQNQMLQPSLPSVPQLAGVHLQLPKQQMRNLLQDQGYQQVSFAPFLDGCLCSRRFMQYLYHLRNRPHDNSFAYWKKFVSEYYAPGSKKRWCFSMYKDIEQHATGVFCPKTMETWCCDICGSKSGKGLETTFETFPRLFKIKFDSGMLDEILFLDSPRACKIPSGLLVLEYRKAIQESVYEKFRVVHEGKLRIVFRHDLKILSWEFCGRNHDEFLLRRLVAPQVGQLVQAAQKYQNDIQNGASVRATSEDLQACCNKFVSAGHQLARNMDLRLVNDLGYPKKFTRSLQIAEVFNSMKDLMAFSLESKMGPIESLNNYTRGCKTVDKMKEKQGMEPYMSPQNLSASPEHHGHEHHANGGWMADNGVASGSAKSALALAELNHQLFMQNAPIASMKKIGKEDGNGVASGSAKSAFTLAELNNQLFMQNASVASMKKKGKEDSCIVDPSNKSNRLDPQSFNHQICTDPYGLPRFQPSELCKNPHQSLIDKMLQEMVTANKGKSAHCSYGKLNNEAAHPSFWNTFGSLLTGPMDKCIESNEQRFGALAQLNSANLSSIASPKATFHGNLVAVGRDITIKTEPHSP